MSSPIGYPQGNAYPMFSATSVGDNPVAVGKEKSPLYFSTSPNGGNAVYGLKKKPTLIGPDSKPLKPYDFSGARKEGVTKMLCRMDYVEGVTMPVTGGGATMSVDSTVLLEGDPTLKISTNAVTGVITVVFPLANYNTYFPVGKLKNMGLVFRLTNAAKLSYINVQLGSSSAFTHSYQNVKAIQSPTEDGIYYTSLYEQDWTVNTGTPDGKDLTHMKLVLLPLSGNSTAPSVDIYMGQPVRFDKRKSRLILSCDDGHTSNMVMADIAEKYGLRITYFPHISAIDIPSGLTKAQIRELHARGHAFGPHSTVHDNVQVQGTATYFKNLLYNREWLLDVIGESRSEDHHAYVGGHTNTQLIAMMKSAGFRSGRCAFPFQAGFHHPGWGGSIDSRLRDPRWMTNTYEWNNTNTAAYIIDRLDKAILYSQDISHYGHHLLESASTYGYSYKPGDVYSFPDVCAAYKDRIDQGLVKHMLAHEYWDEQDGLIGWDL